MKLSGGLYISVCLKVRIIRSLCECCLCTLKMHDSAAKDGENEGGEGENGGWAHVK